MFYMRKHTLGGGRSKLVSSSRSCVSVFTGLKTVLFDCLKMGLDVELPQAPVGGRCSYDGGIDAEGEVKGGKSVDWRDSGGALECE